MSERDPRLRAVTSSEKIGRDVVLTLSCGHVQRRRFFFAAPAAEAICVECKPPADWAARNLHRTTKLPDVARPLDKRMLVAREQMIGKDRTPRAFYLNADDYAQFLRTNPPEMVATFGGQQVTVRGWRGLAVRASQADRRSVLYCCLGTAVGVPPR